MGHVTSRAWGNQISHVCSVTIHQLQVPLYCCTLHHNQSKSSSTFSSPTSGWYTISASGVSDALT